ncbi:HAD family hydrolase [Cytobacillus sp. FJAT-54145]|uniref:HAD family hydrolase n=1 Tax=Cytobacillus spartinae TaxID=3299023 RepID=A0ABW6KJV9_9BACI
MIKAVIFDFDGTIIDTETEWYHIFKDILLKDYGVNLPLEEFAKIIGTTDDVLYQYIDSQRDTPIDRLELKEKVYNRFKNQKDVLLLREGIQEMIGEAQELGLRLAIASSSSRKWITDFLDHFGLTETFPIIKTKEDVEKVKPDPALYLKAVEALEIEPSEAIAIEDSVNGSIAAIEAGLTCVVVPNEVTQFLTFHEKALRYKAFSEVSFKVLCKS